MKKPILALVVIALALLSSSMVWRPAPAFSVAQGEEFAMVPDPQLELYQRCVEGTIVPALILRAVARAESDELDHAVGDGGLSLGRFQLYEVYHSLRAAAWGEYDPHDPEQSGRIAARYLDDCYAEFGCWLLAIAAYRQGIAGVRRNGPTMWYVERVMGRIER